MKNYNFLVVVVVAMFSFISLTVMTIFIKCQSQNFLDRRKNGARQSEVISLEQEFLCPHKSSVDSINLAFCRIRKKHITLFHR